MWNNSILKQKAYTKNCEVRKLDFTIVEEFGLEGTSGAHMVQPHAQSVTSSCASSGSSEPCSTEFQYLQKWRF